MSSIQQLAAEAYRYLTRGIREADGIGPITMPKSKHPEWFTDLCQRAHGDLLPDDWRYEFIRAALSALKDIDIDYAVTAVAIDDLITEARDGLEADVYTHELTAWLHSGAGRLGYVDEALEEWGTSIIDTGRGGSGIFGALALGQLAERQEVFDSVIGSLRSRAEQLAEVEA